MQLVRTHQSFVQRSVRRLGVPEAVADDVAQHVLLTATRKLEAIHPQQERAFLFGIATRMASDARRARRRAQSRVTHEEHGFAQVASPHASPEELLAHKQQREVLQRVLETLPEKERAVFVLYELEDLTVPEIALALSLPEGTVASQLRRARVRFEAAVSRVNARSRGGWTASPLIAIPMERWFGALKAWLGVSSPSAGASAGVGTSAAMGTSAAAGGAHIPVIATAASSTSLAATLSPWVAAGVVGGSLALGSAQVLAPRAPETAAAASATSPVSAAHHGNAQRGEAAERRVPSAVGTSPTPTHASALAADDSTPPLRPAPKPALTAVASTAASIQAELATLRAARALLAGHDPVGALDLLERYARTPGPRTLAQEAQVLRVQALKAHGARSQAQRVGADYLEQHPQSPQAPAVKQLVEDTSP
jgi:RNA polymerase sigma-70 factor (ECF subfamily)